LFEFESESESEWAIIYHESGFRVSSTFNPGWLPIIVLFNRKTKLTISHCSGHNGGFQGRFLVLAD